MSNTKFDLVCRICLTKNEEMLSLIEESETTNLKVMFEICTRITLSEDDGLPELICSTCLKQLELSYDLYEKSQKADLYLRNHINDATIKVEIKDEFRTNNSDDANSIYNEDEIDDSSDIEVIKEHKVKKQNIDKKLKKKNEEICKGPSQCDICGLKVRSHSAMVIHMRTHTGEKPYKCSSCTRSFTQKSSLTIHYDRLHLKKKNKINKDYTCESCGKTFASSNNLKIHLRIHTGEMPYECMFCSKRFMQLGSLNGHTRRHTGEKPYICQVCGKGFVEQNHLKRHQRVHSEEKPYVCNICGKGVKSPFALKQHSKLHTNEKEHICEQCGMSFMFKGNLYAHIKLIHSERSGQCDICDKTFSNIADHMVKHTGEKPFQCEICSKRFSHNKGLIVHSRQHTSENKYKCDVDGCNQSFYAQWVLKCHLMKHAGLTPFSCNYCPKAFLRVCHLTKHMKMSHPDKIKNETSVDS